MVQRWRQCGDDSASRTTFGPPGTAYGPFAMKFCPLAGPELDWKDAIIQIARRTIRVDRLLGMPVDRLGNLRPQPVLQRAADIAHSAWTRGTRNRDTDRHGHRPHARTARPHASALVGQVEYSGPPASRPCNLRSPRHGAECANAFHEHRADVAARR